MPRDGFNCRKLIISHHKQHFYSEIFLFYFFPVCSLSKILSMYKAIIWFKQEKNVILFRSYGNCQNIATAARIGNQITNDLKYKIPAFLSIELKKSIIFQIFPNSINNSSAIFVSLFYTLSRIAFAEKKIYLDPPPIGQGIILGKSI